MEFCFAKYYKVVNALTFKVTNKNKIELVRFFNALSCHSSKANIEHTKMKVRPERKKFPVDQ